MDTIQQLNERIQEKQRLLIENVKKGAEKIIGYTCIYTPVELIRAAGLTPLRLFKGGDETVSISGEFHLRSFFCHFTQFTAGAFRDKDALYSSCEKICAFGTCDQMRRTLDVIDFFYKPVKMFSLPKEHQRETGKDFVHFEILNFKHELEKITGKEISEEAVWEQIRIHNRLRELLRKISAFRKRPNPPLTGRQFLDLVRGYFYLSPEELIPQYEQIYEELNSGHNAGEGAKLRLMIAGGIIADGDFRIVEQLENELGAAVVVEDHCTGLRPFYKNLDEDIKNPYESLTLGYFLRAPCARMRPLSERVRFAGELAKEYRVDGVVYLYLKFCTTYGIPKKVFLDHFSQLGIPTLEISNDYSQSDSGQLRTRFEAFFEVLAGRGNLL